MKCIGGVGPLLAQGQIGLILDFPTEGVRIAGEEGVEEGLLEVHTIILPTVEALFMALYLLEANTVLLQVTTTTSGILHKTHISINPPNMVGEPLSTAVMINLDTVNMKVRCITELNDFCETENLLELLRL